MTSETCLDDTTTSQLLLGTLPAELAEETEQHLLNCASCLEKAQSISVEDDLVVSLRANTDESDTNDSDDKQAAINTLVVELEKLGGTAQIAASAREEIRTILGQSHSDDELGRLRHFRILEVLGAGGMGIVFKAEDCQLNRIVALKAMRPSLAVDPEAKLRFRREAMAVAAFEHDHVVTVYQVEEENGIPFFSMQWLEGESLKERLRREDKLPTNEALRITREIALGLIAAHQRGLLHRDVKPDNIWLQSPDDRVKILDFGLVRSIEERSSLTHSGTILGTPEYMAPEQACGESVDERCDLFSVGCVLYHMLTGHPPFQAKNVVATLVAISNAKVTAPHVVDAEVPRPVSELTVDLLKRDPTERVPSAQALAERIEQLENPQSKHSSHTRPENGSGNRRLNIWPWLAAAAAAIVAGVIAIQTNYGTLNIDADDGIVATIEGDSVRLFDKVTKKKYSLSVGENRLRPGDYEIVAREEASGLEFSSREFTIRRGGEKDVRVFLTPPKPSEPPAATPADSESTEQTIIEELLFNELQAMGEGSQLPSWHTGVSNSLDIGKGAPLSPLALVQQPAPAKDNGFVSWTRETNSHRGGVTDICFSPDGTYTATGGEDGTVRIWKNGKTYRVIVCPGATTGVNSVAWSGTGKLLAATTDKSISIWNMESIDEGPQFLTQLRRKAKKIAWNGDMLAIADNDGVRLWTGGESIPNSGMTGVISSQPWSADGLLLCREKNIIRIWDVVNGTVFATIGSETGDGPGPGKREYIQSPVFDSELGYFAYPVNHYRSQDSSTRYQHTDFVIHDGHAARVKTIRLEELPLAYTWNPDGNGLTCVSRDKVFSINLETNETSSIPLPNDFPRSSSQSTRCKWAKVGNEHRLHVVAWGNVWQRVDNDWKWITGPSAELYISIAKDRIALRVFHQGKRDPSGHLPSNLEVWEKASLEKLFSLPMQGVSYFSLAPDGKTLGVLQDNVVQLFDVDSDQSAPLAETELNAEAASELRFNPSGDKLYVPTSLKGRVILDGRTGEILGSDKSSYRLAQKNWWSADGDSYVRAVDRGDRIGGGPAVLIVNADNIEIERELGITEVVKNQSALIKEDLDSVVAQEKLLTESIAIQKESISSLLKKPDMPARMSPDELAKSEPIRQIFEATVQNDFYIADLEDAKSGLVLAKNSRQRFPSGLSNLLELEFRKLPGVNQIRMDLDEARRQLLQIEALTNEGRAIKEYAEQKAKVDDLVNKLGALRSKGSLRELSIKARKKNSESIIAELAAVEAKLKKKQTLGREIEARYDQARQEHDKPENLRLYLEFRLHELTCDATLLTKVSARKVQLNRALQMTRMSSRGGRGGRSGHDSGEPAWSPDGRYILTTVRDRTRAGVTLYAWDLSADTSTPAWNLLIQQNYSQTSNDYPIFFSTDSKRAALVRKDDVVFVDIEKRELNTQQIGSNSIEGLGWVGNDAFLVEAEDNFLSVSPTKGIGKTINQSGSYPTIVDDRVYSIIANTLHVWNGQLELESAFVLDRVDGQSVLSEILSDGDVRSSNPALKFPMVGLNRKNQFKIVHD